MRRLTLVVGLIAAVTGLGAPVYADAGVQHLVLDLAEDPVITEVDGLGPGCPDITGTLVEERSLHISGTMKADGTGHATTDVVATVVLTPGDAQAVSYTGGYTQHQAGFFVAGGTGERVVTTTTHGMITGSDGSTWRIQEVVHLSVDGQGEVRAWFDRFRCVG